MDQAVLRVALDQLERAVDHQAEWHANVLRAVFCRIPANGDDLDPFAYRLCHFGRWYYESAPAEFRAQDSFVAIGREHERMHRIAGRLLREVDIDTPVVRADFEDFIATSGRLRLQLDALKDTVQAALTNRDVLTGACGRIGMLPELREQHARAQHGGEPCCLVFVDIDNLKQINDKYGHQVGDKVLTAAVQFVNEHLRTRDRVFRYGGDEFLLCLPGADLETGQRVVGRIREELARKLVVRGPDHVALPVTASFGLAQLDPDTSIMESVDRADQALLLAKTAGRNKAISWDSSITTGTHWKQLQCGDASS